MTSRIMWALVFLTAFAVAGLTRGDEAGEGKAAGKPAGFEQFKLLAGEWTGTASGHGLEGQEMHVKYKVTSAGSAVVETVFPNTEHEMVTVIHPDGDDLLLTHYCALGNQPHMKAPGKGDDKIAFKFVRATNLKSDKAMHMHDVTYTFVDKDTLKAEWTHFKDGKDAGHVVFVLKRVK